MNFKDYINSEIISCKEKDLILNKKTIILDNKLKKNQSAIELNKKRIDSLSKKIIALNEFDPNIKIENSEFFSSSEKMYKLCNNVYINRTYDGNYTYNAFVNFLTKQTGRITHNKNIKIMNYMYHSPRVLEVLNWSDDINQYTKKDILNKKIIKLISNFILSEQQLLNKYYGHTHTIIIKDSSYMLDTWNGLLLLS